jgi:hypothetical protein
MRNLAIVSLILVSALNANAQTLDSTYYITKDSINKNWYESDYYSFRTDHPLLIVNGKSIRFDSVNFIKPELIESVQVLKGDKAELYGEKGKNGVLIVNLKQIRKPEDER